MTGYYRWDDHELYNLPHLTQNRSKKNALVHMSSSGQGVQTCHILPHVPLYIIFLPDSPHFEVQTLALDLSFAIMSNYAESWTSTPWQQPDALHAVQHLQTLLCTAENETRDPTVPQRVCSVVGDILGNIEEKIKSHCKHKHLTHVEHRVDTTTGRDLVRIWKCTDVEGCTSYSYDTGTCPEGVYYDWQKIDVVNIWIKKVWKTITSWQMITRNDTEKQLLISQDTDIPEAGISDIGTLMEQAISSSASESQEVNNKVQEIMSTVRDTFPRNVDNWERARSRSPRGSTAQPCDETTLQTPILPAP